MVWKLEFSILQTLYRTDGSISNLTTIQSTELFWKMINWRYLITGHWQWDLQLHSYQCVLIDNISPQCCIWTHSLTLYVLDIRKKLCNDISYWCPLPINHKFLLIFLPILFLNLSIKPIHSSLCMYWSIQLAICVWLQRWSRFVIINSINVYRQHFSSML